MTQKRRMNATKKADALFSAHIRARGICEMAEMFPKIECNGRLQCCHIVSRRYKAVRWNLDNAVSACAAHHLYQTHHPLEWEVAIGERRWWNLRHMALNDSPMDPQAVIDDMETT